MALGVVMAAEDAPDMLVLLACIFCACATGVVCTLAYGAWMHARMRREFHIYTVKKHVTEVIELEESPIPTRSARLITSESHRRMAESVRARRRGGRRRFGRHKRVMTRLYNPPAEHHCGHACVLRAKGVEPTSKRIQELRNATADIVYRACIDDEHVHGVSVRGMVQDTDMSLQAYLAGVRRMLRASIIEVYYAAQSLEVPIAVSSKGRVVCWRDNPKYVIKLQNQHYTLHSSRRKAKDMDKGSLQQERGGMRPGLWTWEDESVPVSITYRPSPPTPPPEEIPEWAIRNTPLQTVATPEELSLPPSEERSLPMPYVTRVHVSPSVRTDVSSVELIVKPGTTLLHMRVRVASLLAVSPHRVGMTDLDNNEIPLHHPVPVAFRVHDRWASQSDNNDILDVYLAPMGKDSSFVFRVCRVWTHELIIEKLASIIGVPSNNMVVTDMNGGEWHYPESRATSMSVMVLARMRTQVTPPLVNERGGARTVSTTVPYEEAQSHEVGDNENQETEHYVHVNHAVLVEGGNIEDQEGQVNEGVMAEGDRSELYEMEIGEHQRLRRERQSSRSRSPLRTPPAPQPAATAHGGILYMPDEQTLTERALRRHRRLMARVNAGEREPTRPPSQAGSSTPSDALLTCSAWPVSPPPAQPDMVPRPIEDDLGAVGAVQAYPYTKAVDVVEKMISKVKPIDLVQVIPMSAYLWKDVEKIVFPPPTKVIAHDPVDLRLSRWELYQRVRQVPVMSHGVVQRTLILPWHITMEHAKMRIDERAPPHKDWLLTAASPQDWILH